MVNRKGYPDIQGHTLDLKRWYVADHLLLTDSSASNSRIEQLYAKSVKHLEVYILLDGIHDFFRMRSSIGIRRAFQNFGARIGFVGGGSLTYLTNHTKIISSEHQSLIQGNELVDKTYAWSPQQLEWHDAGVLIEGQLVNQVNRYFFDQFNAVASKNVEYNKHSHFYLPEENESPPSDFQQGGRLVTHSHMSTQNVNKVVLAIAIAAAQEQILAETPFFADLWHARLIQEKARQFQLPSLSVSQCTPSSKNKRIAVTLSRYLDQPLVKISSDSLINSLLKSGVSLCKWDGARYNQAMQGIENKQYQADAMMHLKIWSIDSSLAYIGTANWLARSRTTVLGDLEIGLLTNDPQLVQEIQERILLLDLKHSEPTQTSQWNIWATPIRWIFSDLLKIF